MSSDEGASIHSIEDGDLNEVLEIGEDLQADTEEVPAGDQNENDAQDEEKQVVKPKRVVRNPQPKLNEETLQGPRGIVALGSHFDRVKFKGRGYEEQDLNVVMKTYEYWCHRLFPKFPFDTCIERLEKLGTKRAVQTHIKRIRFDLLLNDDIIESSDDEANVDNFVDVDRTNVVLDDTRFDQLTATNNSQLPDVLTTEQLERMKVNKERAEKLRQERLKKIQEKVNNHLELSREHLSQSPGPSGLNSYDDIHTLSPEEYEPDLERPMFDHESSRKGKQLIKKSKRKLSRQAEKHDEIATENKGMVENAEIQMSEKPHIAKEISINPEENELETNEETSLSYSQNLQADQNSNDSVLPSAKTIQTEKKDFESGVVLQNQDVNSTINSTSSPLFVDRDKDIALDFDCYKGHKSSSVPDDNPMDSSQQHADNQSISKSKENGVFLLQTCQQDVENKENASLDKIC